MKPKIRSLLQGTQLSPSSSTITKPNLEPTNNDVNDIVQNVIGTIKDVGWGSVSIKPGGTTIMTEGFSKGRLNPILPDSSQVITIITTL